MAMQAELREQLRELFKSGYFIEAQTRKLAVIDPIATPPAWMTAECEDALNAIVGAHERKKRTTVLRIAEALASGVSSTDKCLTTSTDTCSLSVWHGRRAVRAGRRVVNGREPGWKHDPAILHALEVCKRRAHWYYDQEEQRRIALRRIILGETQDRLTELSGMAAEVLADVMLEADNDDVRRKAAVDVLTHAAPETAPKLATSNVVEMRVDSGGPTMRDIRNRRRAMSDEPALPSPEEDAEYTVLGDALAESEDGAEEESDDGDGTDDDIDVDALWEELEGDPEALDFFDG